MAGARDPMRAIRRAVAAAAIMVGWGFIVWQNHLHVTAPVVFVGLGYLALVVTIYNLWRTGAAVVGPDEPVAEDADSTIARVGGAAAVALEREKRTLIKAIKEAEFDREMGKLSQRDADDMIGTFRARAIEVIKELEHLTQGAAASAREQILREVRARVELAAKAEPRAAHADGKPDAAADDGAGKPAGRPGKGKKAKPEPRTSTTEGLPVATAAAEASAAAVGAEGAAGTDDAEGAEGADDAEGAEAASARAAAAHDAAIAEGDRKSVV